MRTIGHTNVGDTIELVSTTDQYTTLTPGARGTVMFIDDCGTIHTRWEDGNQLGLIPGIDQWRVLRHGAEEGAP